MTGRSLYVRLAWFIELVVSLYSIFPVFMRRGLYSFFCSSHWFLAKIIRYLSFRTLCKRCGSIVNIGAGVVVKNWDKLEIGNRVNIHEYCFIDAIGEITIEDDVSIAHHTSLLSFEHGWSEIDKPIKYNALTLKPVTIKSDVWVGCGVRILAGTTIGTRTIIAAGAVLPSGEYSSGVYGGVPARVLKVLD